MVDLEFHPLAPQTQYHGEAVFSHQHGETRVVLAGTGVAASVAADETVDFGVVRFKSKILRYLHLHNNGLLPAPFYLLVCQPFPFFSFVEFEPYEASGVVAIGETVSIAVACECFAVPQISKSQSRAGNVSHSGGACIQLKWKPVQHGNFQSQSIPMYVYIGEPQFVPSLREIDFLTSYIGVGRSLTITVVNGGNAACSWSVTSESSLVTVTPSSGVLEMESVIDLTLTFSPASHEPLRSLLMFRTDAGQVVLTCSGIVGVAYLEAPSEILSLVDFGVCAVNKRHTRSIPLSNTGRRSIKCEAKLLSLQEDGIDVAEADNYPVFFAEPSSFMIPPLTTVELLVVAIPCDFQSVSTGTLVIATGDGEKIQGIVRCIGGQAIVRIKLPDMSRLAQTASSDPQNQLPIIPTTILERILEQQDVNTGAQAVRLVLESHMDTLMQVLNAFEAATREYLPQPQTRPRTSKRSHPLTTASASFPSRSIHDVVRGESADGSREKSSSQSQSLKRTIQSAPNHGAATYISTSDSPDTVSKSRLKGIDNQLFDHAPSNGLSAHSRPTSYAEGAGLGGGELGASFDTSSVSSKRVHFAGTELEAARDSDRQHVATSDDPGSIAEHFHDFKLNEQIGTSDARLGSGASNDLQHRSSTNQSTSGSNFMTKLSLSREGRRESSHSHHQNSANKRMATAETGAPINPLAKNHTNEEMETIRAFVSPIEENIRATFAIAEHLKSLCNENVDATTIARIQSDLLRRTESLLADLENSDLLSTFASLPATLRNLQESCRYVKQVSTGAKASPSSPTSNPTDLLLTQQLPSTDRHSNSNLEMGDEGLSKNDYFLGLVKGGARSSTRPLFTIPNAGNMSLTFSIQPRHDAFFQPPQDGAVSDVLQEQFSLEPRNGVLLPEQSVTFQISFAGTVTGFYQQMFDIIGNEELVTSFSVSARVGNPIITVSPTKLDFGMVAKSKCADALFTVANVGTYTDFIKVLCIYSHLLCCDCFRLNI